uniref:Uncharacterized protein n=1 Tax=Meloidogyne incognita TaxID=6306 RepID=A0A914MY94_MELIC
MSIEVIMELRRKGGCFLTGEDVEVEVTFKNTHQELSKSIAWSCVQLFCEASSLNDKESVKRQRLKTSFTKAKNAIFASDPTLLFCDMTMNPGEGHYKKYFWYISCAAQQPESPLKMSQLPIKVLNIGVDVEEPPIEIEETPKELLDCPDFKLELSRLSIVEIAMAKIQEICSSRKRRLRTLANF